VEAYGIAALLPTAGFVVQRTLEGKALEDFPSQHPISYLNHT
jgi:hypothetical protein